MDAKRKNIEEKAKETVGKLTGDKEHKFEGKAEKIIGGVQENVKKAKDKATA